MIPTLQIKDYIIASLVVIVLILSGFYYWLKHELNQCKTEKQLIENALYLQSQMIENNKAEYERNLEQAKQDNSKVRTEYVTKIKYIQKATDENLTCNTAMQFLDSYSY